jgi:hypothetical protein
MVARPRRTAVLAFVVALWSAVAPVCGFAGREVPATAWDSASAASPDRSDRAQEAPSDRSGDAAVQSHREHRHHPTTPDPDPDATPCDAAMACGHAALAAAPTVVATTLSSAPRRAATAARPLHGVTLTLDPPPPRG